MAGDGQRTGRRGLGALAARATDRIRAARRRARSRVYPAIAIAGFAIFSRVVVGAWFVGSDFFVAENKALGDPMMAAAEIGWGAQTLSGTLLTWIGGFGVAIAVTIGLVSRVRAGALAVLALLGMAAVPWTAFLEGHPFRIRYMVPLMAIEAIGAGIAAGIVPARRRACGVRDRPARARRLRAPSARLGGADGRRSAVGPTQPAACARR